MILDSILLENFGVYGGLHEIHLSPTTDKAIILIGGMNGRGKTTLLDALQLVLYGPRAKVSNRGRMAYRDFLAECIYRGANPTEGARITLRFRRIIQGEVSRFEITRSWIKGDKGVEEKVNVARNGYPDDNYTENWDEVIEAYLPVSISNLFFFDGEQIKDLAEGDNAAAILGSAIRSLLGLDLVDRLESDLRVFERKKKQERLDPESALELAVVKVELAQLDIQWEQLSFDIGRAVNDAGRLAKELRINEDEFRNEGGEWFLKRKDLEANLARLKQSKNAEESRLRELAAGVLPLSLINGLLGEVETQARKETAIRHNRILVEAIEERDSHIISLLESKKTEPKVLEHVKAFLLDDRIQRQHDSDKPLILDGADDLASHVLHLRSKILPDVTNQARSLITSIRSLDEAIARAEADLIRVPEEDVIAFRMKLLSESREAHAAKLAQLDSLKARQEALKRHREEVIKRMDRLGDRNIDATIAEDSRLRILKHSAKVRDTLTKFRTRVVEQHVARMETLILESFLTLLRKTDLVQGIKIDPKTFNVTLLDYRGSPLPFDRLSAGERQLFATAMLWGLARASGRPVPTVIDTPLGRLDSSHRRHLVERYFPFASHQVILLSTDEEIVGSYFSLLEPSIARNYLIQHDEKLGQSSVHQGYFNSHEATR